MVNDTAEDVEIDMNIVALAMDGNRVPLKSANGTCTSDKAATLTDIDMDSLPDGAILAWNFIASNGMTGEGHHVRDTYKALELQPAGLEFSVGPLKNGQFEIDVTAAGLALFIMLEADQPGRYSDNLFDLAAGETRRIIFTPKGAGPQPHFRIFDLHTCQSSPNPGIETMRRKA